MHDSGDAVDVFLAQLRDLHLDGGELHLPAPVSQEVVLVVLGQPGALEDRDVVRGRDEQYLQVLFQILTFKLKTKIVKFKRD